LHIIIYEKLFTGFYFIYCIYLVYFCINRYWIEKKLLIFQITMLKHSLLLLAEILLLILKVVYYICKDVYRLIIPTKKKKNVSGEIVLVRTKLLIYAQLYTYIKSTYITDLFEYLWMRKYLTQTLRGKNINYDLLLILELYKKTNFLYDFLRYWFFVACNININYINKDYIYT